MSSIDKHIKDLIQFYVKENYKHYLTKNNITHINEPDIEGVVSELYDSKKDNIKVFVMDSLKTILKSEMPPEIIIQNILNDILRDDKLCKNRIILEIKLHQSKEGDKVKYSKIM